MCLYIYAILLVMYKISYKYNKRGDVMGCIALSLVCCPKVKCNCLVFDGAVGLERHIVQERVEDMHVKALHWNVCPRRLQLHGGMDGWLAGGRVELKEAR